MTAPRVPIAIIGAGPYGLSIAAHLRGRGVDFRIFGSPMGYWLDMPEAMALKSEAFETNISAPAPGYGFVEYRRKRGLSTEQPIDAGDFNEYALWAQRSLVPDVED